MSQFLPVIASIPATFPAEEFDCQKCGACCAHFANEDLSDIGRRGRGIFIADDDTNGLPPSLVIEYGLTYAVDKWLRARKVGEHWQCKALTGQIGQSCSCSVYEKRPETCRKFEAGSMPCRTARFAVLSFEGEQR